VGRRSKFFLKRSNLLTSQFGGGLVLNLYAFFGQGLDHPVHTNIQVFGRLL
jgi:hypothetical protein